jgi:ABC-type nitrate/sulfonate/bicarbonate transport system substrate-binding protein
MRSRLQLACVILAALAAFSCASAPGPAQARKVVITYPNKSGSQWPLFLAKETGAYAKYGLDVDLQFVAFPGNVAALASGQSQMVNTSLEQNMQAASKDGSLAVIGSSLNRGTFALVATNKIRSVPELKRKRIAVTQIGDAPYGYVVAILAKAGLTDRDVEWIPVGGPVAGRAAALTSGRADATILTAPSYFKLENEGFNVLVNLAERDDIFASTGYLVATRDLQDGPLMEALIKAHAEAIRTFYADKAAAIAAYRKYDPEISPEDAERTYELYARPQAFERVPYVLRPAVEAVVAQQSDPQIAGRMRAFDWRTVIDNRVVDKLVAEGFFTGLFGEAVRAEQERKAALAFR